MSKTLLKTTAIYALMCLMAAPAWAGAGHHFYTADVNEAARTKQTWQYEGAMQFVYDGVAGTAGGHCSNSQYTMVEYWQLTDGGVVDKSGCVPKNSVALFRGYKQSGNDHFYTIDVPEFQRAVTQLGFVEEGIAGFVMKPTSSGGCPANTLALFRFYNQNAQDHFYTTSVQEKNSIISAGGQMKFERVEACMPTSPSAGTRKFERFYRYFSSPSSGSGFWTTLGTVFAVAIAGFIGGSAYNCNTEDWERQQDGTWRCRF
jgi:hypothetical protein